MTKCLCKFHFVLCSSNVLIGKTVISGGFLKWPLAGVGYAVFTAACVGLTVGQLYSARSVDSHSHENAMWILANSLQLVPKLTV